MLPPNIYAWTKPRLQAFIVKLVVAWKQHGTTQKLSLLFLLMFLNEPAHQVPNCLAYSCILSSNRLLKLVPKLVGNRHSSKRSVLTQDELTSRAGMKCLQ